jgi:uncharacterized protein YyaL (SSP411 family)
MPNRLIHETSPYLLQHAHNPVDWYPWGPEALAAAKAADKPILLSIGYSACHWCHVMEHESFENPEIAGLMNDLFISIKVDREERPDLDSIYIAAVQALSGQGGWPMSVFLTPDGQPFFGGTYYPPDDRPGMPGFRRVLTSVAAAYNERRAEVTESAGELQEYLAQRMDLPGHSGALDPGVLDRAFAAQSEDYESRYGGFGSQPKFPQAMAWEFVLRYHYRTGNKRALLMLEHTLWNMARGGIYDQLGGGFARYSTDVKWLVPHFEKMLYDNALLSRLYLHAYQLTGDPFYRRIVEETLDYVRREMVSPEGGFYSTQDADSEGEEGKFFVWTPDEIAAVLGPDDARVVNAYYDVTEQGNFEHKNVLSVPRPVERVAADLEMTPDALLAVIEGARPRLFAAREARIHPGTDTKILTGWNGLMLRSFAEASRVLDRADYRETAEANARFVQRTLLRDGRLLRTYKDGQAKIPGFLEDYAFYADGLLALYEATFDAQWFTAARGLADQILAHFPDAQGGGFFDTPDDGETLIHRPKDLLESAIPSGNSVAAAVLQRLALFTAEDVYREAAENTLVAAGALLAQYPSAVGEMLCALDFYLSSPQEIALIGDSAAPDMQALLKVIVSAYRPYQVVAAAAPGDEAALAAIPLLADRPQRNGQATAYVCRNYACQRPVTSPAELAEQLEAEVTWTEI